jgi:glycosyltransferase involved in cell wall biosynthesis
VVIYLSRESEGSDARCALTIGIPTFNGSESIGKTIDSVLAQVDSGKLGNVEIVVSNNASTDGTESIVLQYESRHPDLIAYYRNETNVGFDANVDLIVKRARGRFVWFLSDDDGLKEGAIDEMLGAIQAYPDAALIFANFEGGSAKLNCEEREVCRDGDVFFRRIDYLNNLISSNIVNREVWLGLDMKRHYGCLWIHFAYAIEALAPNSHRYAVILKGTHLMYGPYLLEKPQREGRDPAFCIHIGFKLFDLLQEMPRLSYSREVKEMAVLRIKAPYPRDIPWIKAQGLVLNRKLLRGFYTRYKMYPTFWVIYLPLLLIPGDIYLFWFRLRQHPQFRTKK